jgi:hypothetical protein
MVKLIVVSLDMSEEQLPEKNETFVLPLLLVLSPVLLVSLLGSENVT